ncbi:ATP-binding cassette domain-containing protein [Nocardiopsis coralliicola]
MTLPAPEHALEAAGLTKSFGTHRALSGVDLALPRGCVLGLLGPNGAGKTTTVRILTTLLRPDGGSARVAGCDVVHDAAGVRRRIGASGQYAAVDGKLTGHENLVLVGRLYGLRRREARRRADELLERFGLADLPGRRAEHYSGGMRRRLDLAGALVARPEVVVLDEPTTGLDPRGRQDVWRSVEDLVADGTSVLLTTQYLEEADRLADDIVVVDHGRVIARGSADALKARTGGERIDVLLAGPGPSAAAAEAMAAAGGRGPRADSAGRLTAAAPEGQRTLARALTELEDRGIGVVEAALRRPTLDEVFLSLTAHRAEPPVPDTAESEEARR